MVGKQRRRLRSRQHGAGPRGRIRQARRAHAALRRGQERCARAGRYRPVRDRTGPVRAGGREQARLAPALTGEPPDATGHRSYRRNRTEDPARSVKPAPRFVLADGYGLVAHDLVRRRDDAGKGADVVGYGGHHCGERDSRRCLAHADMISRWCDPARQTVGGAINVMRMTLLARPCCARVSTL
jgi:hypothetical protein